MGDDERPHNASLTRTGSRTAIDLGFDERGLYLRLPWEAAEGLFNSSGRVRQKLAERVLKRSALNEQIRRERVEGRVKAYWRNCRLAARTIRTMEAQGVPRRDAEIKVAEKLRVPVNELRQSVSRHNAKAKARQRRKRKSIAKRMKAAGASNREIGERFGVSSQRVSQWLKNPLLPSSERQHVHSARADG